jgi:hypothetical protein
MTADKETTSNINVTSNYQSGGITAHTVNLNPTYQRKLGNNARKELLQNTPRNKEIVIWATMGSEEAYKLASEIFQFMKGAGYTLFGDGPFPQIFVPALYGMRVRLNERTEIDVGLMDESEKASGRAA